MLDAKKYLINLLTLCSQEDRDYHDEMYPDGVEEHKIIWAISQAENTLRAKSIKLKESLEDAELLRKEIVSLKMQNSHVLKKLSDSRDDLDFLARLEACGVDHWSGYEQAQEMELE